MDCTANDSVAQPASVLGAVPGELVMKVDGGNRHGEVVRFREAKLTLGSSRACTFAVAGERVRPVQCLILRGARGTLVRNWTPDTQLNGRPFSDAVLRRGDRLQLGEVQLEILDDGRPVPEAAADRAEEALAPKLPGANHNPLSNMARVEHWLNELNAETCAPSSSVPAILVAFTQLQQRLLAELEALACERAAWQAERAQWQAQFENFLRRATAMPPTQAPRSSERPEAADAPWADPRPDLPVMADACAPDRETVADLESTEWTETPESDAAPESNPESYSVGDPDSEPETYTPAFADAAESEWPSSPADASATDEYPATDEHAATDEYTATDECAATDEYTATADSPDVAEWRDPVTENGEPETYSVDDLCAEPTAWDPTQESAQDSPSEDAVEPGAPDSLAIPSALRQFLRDPQDVPVEETSAESFEAADACRPFQDDSPATFSACDEPSDESAPESYDAADAEPISPDLEDAGTAASAAALTPTDGPESLRALLKSIWKSDPLAEGGTKSARVPEVQEEEPPTESAESWDPDGDQDGATADPYADNADAGMPTDPPSERWSATAANEEPILDPTFAGLDEPQAMTAEDAEQDGMVPSDSGEVGAELASETASPRWSEPTEDSGDASINEYLARLLQRVGGPTGHKPAPESSISAARTAAAATAENKSPSTSRLALLEEGPPPRTGRSFLNKLADPEAEPEAAAAESEFHSADVEEERPATIRPRPEVPARVTPPECETSLEAMRELANFSARSAIHAFDQQRSRRIAWIYVAMFLIGLVGVVVSVILLVRAAQPLAFGGLGLGGLVAAFAGFKALRLSRFGSQNPPSPKAKPADSPRESRT